MNDELRKVSDLLGSMPNSGEEIMALVRETGGDPEAWEAGLRRLAREEVQAGLDLLEVYLSTVRGLHEEWTLRDYEALAVLLRRLSNAAEVAAMEPGP